MNSITSREKLLIVSNVVLAILVLFLLYKVIGYNLTVVNFDFAPPQTMEANIKSSNLIFKCENKIIGDTLECFVEEILYKDENFVFPFSIGDSYPPLKKKIEKNTRYGSGNVVLLTPKLRTSARYVPIYNGILKGFDNITIDEFIETVKKIK